MQTKKKQKQKKKRFSSKIKKNKLGLPSKSSFNKGSKASKTLTRELK